jgi:5-methylcytosine-specific restriction endonuclease McrA
MHTQRARTICAVLDCAAFALPNERTCEQHRRRSSQQWRKVAALVVKRADGRCERCGQPARLSGHHVRPLVLGGNELVGVDEALALCASCQAVERPASRPALR